MCHCVDSPCLVHRMNFTLPHTMAIKARICGKFPPAKIIVVVVVCALCGKGGICVGIRAVNMLSLLVSQLDLALAWPWFNSSSAC